MFKIRLYSFFNPADFMPPDQQANTDTDDWNYLLLSPIKTWMSVVSTLCMNVCMYMILYF